MKVEKVDGLAWSAKPDSEMRWVNLKVWKQLKLCECANGEDIVDIACIQQE